MSDQQEDENDEASEDGEAIDPLGPTQVDPKRAFEMGAETPDANAAPAHWSPPEPEVLDPLFPDYDLTELIGRGGMGAVYRGVQKSLDRPVAIKVLPPEMAEADPSFAARFEREAKSMARLDHPNIVHVYDFGRTEAGHWFIVMEFVDGMDFHQLIRSGELDQTGALNAVSQICDALEYAHAQGYVHRDIKPANIFINQKGILKVGDFGLAKMIEGESGDTTIREPRQPMLTQTGISMGTPDYCSPEQLEGRHIDHRADIYSLGVMFYEMLTRELPRGNFPPPSKKVQVDVRIDDVVLRAMESEPEMRYSTAGEMRTEVDEVRTGPVVEPLPVAGESRPASVPAKSNGWRAVAIALIILVGGYFGVLIFITLLGMAVALLQGKPTVTKTPNDSPEVEVTDRPFFPASELPQTPENRYGLPAFHGELRPIPDLRAEPERLGLSLDPSAPSASATKDAPFANSLGMEFVPVPIPNGSSGGKRVLFSRWETRVSDYRAFAEATDREWPAPKFEQGDDHPAVNVSWEDAVAFCGWLSVREREAGTIGQLERYRLPTDHEWSCAVEIGHLENPNFSPISKSPPKQDRPPPGTDTAVKGYPMGDRVYGGFANSAGEETKAAGLSNNIVRGMEDGYAATAPVGNYKPNRFGLFDISGNVWEWCQDTVDPDSKDTRVRRGACWKTVFIPAMRSARREGATQDSRTDTTGFRCVLSEP